ncbi:hypothetical protein H6G27_29825 [Nostoc linckia FACHB-104]|nr:hypothetical protein [Nostoc linckia FACHB-104]
MDLWSAIAFWICGVRSLFGFVECDRVLGLWSAIAFWGCEMRSRFGVLWSAIAFWHDILNNYCAIAFQGFVEMRSRFGMISSIIIVRSRSLTKLFARW